MTERPPLHAEQKRPATAIREHCLLAAGAGSGKTRVLVERYLNILADGGWDPRLPARILAVTFTEKAALEMRGRVGAEIAAREAGAVAAEREALRTLGRELESAPISTIHGFCSRVLREHAVEAGLDPRFRVPSELELAELRDGVTRELIATGDPDLAALAAEFRVESLFAALESLRELRRSLGLDAAELAGAAAARLAAAQDEALRALVEGELLAAQGALAAAVAGLGAHLPGGTHPEPAGRAKIAAARALLAARDLARPQPGLAEALRQALSRLRTRGKGLEDGGRLHADYEAIKKGAEALGGLLAAWQAAADDAPGRALRAAVFRLCGRYATRIDERMRARAWLDFEDLQLETVALLRRQAGVRRRLQELYLHVLVDECQDTNRLQLDLLRLLVPPATDPTRRALFLVGDERQSIYGFRNADVAVFRAERARMAARGEAHSLEFNHRSRPGLLRCVNAVFPAPEFPPLRSTEPLPAGEPPRVLLQITPRAPGETRADQRPHAARALVAALQAARAEGLVVGVGEKARPIDWGDMAILVRSGASVRPLVRALAEAELPYAADAGREYYLRRELLDLEALVAALDDPFHPLTLARGLRSDLVGLSRADLLALLALQPERRGRDRGELLARLERAAAEGAIGLSADGRARLADFLALRRRFAGRLTRLPLAELLPALISATDYELRAAAALQGLRILRNLRQLADLLGELESGRRLSLREFVAGMAALRERAARQQEAWVPEEGGSLLRILTIHGAKGLEFPLVALFDLDRGLRPGGRSGEFALLQAELPAGPTACLGLRRRDPALPSDAGSADLASAWIASEARRRESAEDLRLLYVAMTRAQDYLILAGGAPLAEAADFPADFLAAAGDATQDFLTRIRLAVAAPAFPRDSLLLARAGQGDRLAGARAPRRASAAAAPAAAPDWSSLLRLAPAPPRLELSVTSLALLGSCPLRWLLERRLGLGLVFRAEAEPWRPAPRAEFESTGAGGAALGTALHAILERWDFRRPFAAAFTAACPAALSPALREEARALLADFFAAKQPWLARLAEAESLQREEPYVHALGGVLLRGQVDLVFTWRRQRILIDWKSDRVAGRDHIQRRLGHHRFQVLLYALALAGAGQPLDQALLVFLRTGEEGGFRQVHLAPFDLEWAANHARRLAELAQQLSALAAAPGAALLDAVPRGQDPPCQDCPFRNGPCPRSYRSASHGLRNWPPADAPPQA
ncbi:hypothetical protein FJ251_05090 [bacterium]|nr:hypothetical protein [bacterium]